MDWFGSAVFWLVPLVASSFFFIGTAKQRNHRILAKLGDLSGAPKFGQSPIRTIVFISLSAAQSKLKLNRTVAVKFLSDPH